MTDETTKLNNLILKMTAALAGEMLLKAMRKGNDQRQKKWVEHIKKTMRVCDRRALDWGKETLAMIELEDRED